MTDSTVVCFQYDIVGHLSVNVEMPAAGSDSPCLAVEEVWRTSPTFILCKNPWIDTWVGKDTPLSFVCSRLFLAFVDVLKGSPLRVAEAKVFYKKGNRCTSLGELPRISWPVDFLFYLAFTYLIIHCM